MKYQRKNNVIRGPEGDKKFESISLAKKESHRLQIAEDGYLGRGCLRVVEKLK